MRRGGVLPDEYGGYVLAVHCLLSREASEEELASTLSGLREDLRGVLSNLPRDSQRYSRAGVVDRAVALDDGGSGGSDLAIRD